MKPLLVIVTGLPATGKTTLGKRLAAALRLPFIHKDGIKELLFDMLGWSDIAWSQRLGRASIELLYYFAEAQLMVGSSLVIENNFDAALATPKFLAWQAKYDVATVQVVCMADSDVIWQCYQARWEAGQKHPGHVQHLDPRGDSWTRWPQGKVAAMDIGGQVIVVDTTDFATLDYDGLLRTVQSKI